MNILFVDDDAEFGEGCARWFEQKGYRVDQTTGGQDAIDCVAPMEKPVLIEGESGTGKELVAAAIHAGSSRADPPLVTVNSAALPAQLVVSKLFGHEKGSFTEATMMKPGLFEVAEGSPLFIDEMGELPLALQPKLLRILEDGSLRRVESATNRDMSQQVAQGPFREDLYYRINVISLDLPALRDRGDEIELLNEHFLGDEYELDADVKNALLAYSWPSNIPQLINTIDRSKILADDRLIKLDIAPTEIARAASVTNRVPPVPSASNGASCIA